VLHFAYGSNMDRSALRRRCPTAEALGVARLEGWRFLITVDGFAGVARTPGSTVHGVLWDVRPRDLAALNAYEGLAAGLYRRVTLPVMQDGQRRAALVYLPRRSVGGRPKAGCLDGIVAAAQAWRLPGPYIVSLRRWSPAGFASARVPDTGEVG
jgi:gamma-glutamylcyclotransferase (GGCT)/AIG2-like uncharacterized protein YtfP